MQRPLQPPKKIVYWRHQSSCPAHSRWWVSVTPLTRPLNSAVRSGVKREFSKEHKSLWNSADKQEKHCVQQRYSQKAFQSTNRHHLPRIYCSNTNVNCTMVLCQKCHVGYSYRILFNRHIKCIKGVMEYNLQYFFVISVCAFMYRPLFFI